MRTTIDELVLNTQCVLPCILQAASPRKTRGGKPYLNVTAFDGHASITGNYWDWAGKAIPDCGNTVYDISATVSEYMGQKQLNISGIKTSTDFDLTDFIPSSGVNVKDIYKDAISLATEEIDDDFLRSITLGILTDYMEAWLTVPGAVSIHHAYVGGTLVHSLSVAHIACSIADVIPFADKSLVVAGALLHDFGKLFSYELHGAGINMTDTGKMFEHLYIGAREIECYVDKNVTVKNEEDLLKLKMLIHIILSHHGSLEYGSVVNTLSVESIIVSNADNIDAACEQIRSASAATENFWTDKIYTLNNKPVINYKATKSLLDKNYSEDDDLPFQ